MTIYLHIGIGKTGTTSIQTFLEMNAATLATRGVITPTSLAKRNHRKLTMYSLNDDVIDNLRRAKGLLTPESIHHFRQQALEDFRTEISKWTPGQTVVMTSEQMTRLRRPGEISRLKEFVSLAGDADIRVIVYLRRQDLYYVSEYSQEIKGGKDIPFRPDGKVVNRDIYFYDRLLGYWQEVFGKSALIVRPFERVALKNGDAIDDFMALIGMDDLQGLERPPPRNASLDAYTVEFLRRLNPSVPRWVNGGEDHGRLQLVEALEAVSTGPKLRMSHDNAEKFLSLFADSNAFVAREYMGKERLFEEQIADTPGMEPTLPLEAAQRLAKSVFGSAIVTRLDCDGAVAAVARAWNDLKRTGPENSAAAPVRPRKAARAGTA